MDLHHIMETYVKRNLIGALTAAIAFTAFMFWTDEDPPYANPLHTISEVVFLTALFFGIFLCIFMGLHLIARKIRQWTR